MRVRARSPPGRPRRCSPICPARGPGAPARDAHLGSSGPKRRRAPGAPELAPDHVGAGARAGRRARARHPGRHGDAEPRRAGRHVPAFERLVRRGTPEALESGGGALSRAAARRRAGRRAGLRGVARVRARAAGGAGARRALRRLVDRHLKRGRVEAATPAATGCSPSTPCRRRRIARSCGCTRARAGARPRCASIRPAWRCSRRKLGVEPEPATRRLYLEILQRAAAPSGGAAARPAGRPDASRPRRRRAAGRSRSRAARLRPRSRRVAREGGVVLVTGEAGIGKSRLLDEAPAMALARGTRSSPAAPTRASRSCPSSPGSMRCAPARRSERSRPSPRPRSRGAPSSPGCSPSSVAGAPRRPLLPRAISGSSRRSTTCSASSPARAPLLLVLEDVHWADEMTLRLFAFVARRLAGRPLLLVASAREEDLVEAPGLTPAVRGQHARAPSRGSRRAWRAVRRRHRHAGAGAGARAPAAMPPGSPSREPRVDPQRGQSVRDRRDHAGAARRTLAEAAGVELPRRVREVIAARLARLSPRAQELAPVVGVITRDSTSRAPACGRQSRRATAEAVEELVRRRMLDTRGDRSTSRTLASARRCTRACSRRAASAARRGRRGGGERVRGPARRELRPARASLLPGRRARPGADLPGASGRSGGAERRARGGGAPAHGGARRDGPPASRGAW